MMPMLSFSPPPSVLNVYARVDKATSEFLNSPDWRINIAICDAINTNPWLAKDYMKAIRGRLQQKIPNIQLLSLTLLETIIKNCGEVVHVQMAERKMLNEMIRIVKKKGHMRVREKILMLIDTWQEAFGSRGGKTTTQYFRAYEELRRSGVQFPHRSPNSVPVITPPATHGHLQGGAGSSSSSRNESTENVRYISRKSGRNTTKNGMGKPNLSTLKSMRDVMDLLSEMLQAVDPKNRMAVKDEIIVDLYNQCRSNQKKLGETLASTTDEEILCQGIQFNDAVQYVIEKHDAIASGSPLPVEPPSLMPSRSNGKQIDTTEMKLKSTSVASSPTPSSSTNEIQEDPDSSTPVASRHKETQTVATQDDKKPVSDPSLSLSMALVPSDPLPPPSKKASEEDLIDLLSLALTPSIPNETPPAPAVAETLPQAQQMNTYVVPWAQNQPQFEYESQQSVQSIQQQGTYIPPPWAPTPGYYCNPYASNYSSPSYYNNSYNSSVAGSSLNPYIPSYRLFEDLNVLGNLRTNGTPGTSGPGMLGARK